MISIVIGIFLFIGISIFVILSDIISTAKSCKYGFVLAIIQIAVIIVIIITAIKFSK